MLWDNVYIGSQVICSFMIGICHAVPTKKTEKSTIRRSTKPRRGTNRKSQTRTDATNTKDTPKKAQAREEMKSLGLLLALEPRIMFDGAAFVTGAEIIQDQSTQDVDLQGIDDDLEPETSPDPFNNSVDLLSALSTTTAPSDRKEIVFIDTSVEDFETLLLGINPSAEAILLDSTRDGMEQIAEILGQRADIDAVHIISHGNQAELQLGTGHLTLDSMNGKYTDEFAIIKRALTEDADFLIYGCNFGQGDGGQNAASHLAGLTGADIAASNDLTGRADLGGDWDLELTTGTIETSIVLDEQAQQNFAGLLATVTVNTTNDLIDGGDTSSITNLIATPGTDGISLREAIQAANNTSGADTITFTGSGTYQLTITGTNENAAVRGDLDITDDLTLTGNGATSTIIDGNGADRVLHIRNSATATISGITIQNGISSGSGGAGVRIEASSTLNLSDATVTNNNGTGGDGGAFHVHGTLNLDRVLVSNNSADLAGGIYYHGADGGSLTNVTISGNTATGNGGGLWTDTAISVKNSTITLNNGTNGGGIFASSATVTISNTIVSDNIANSTNDDVVGTFSSDGSNLIQTVSGASGFGGGDLTGTSANLVGLANNGGPTQTHALLTGNAAINAGTTSGAPAVDQRGVARDGMPDIGAFEFGGGVNEVPVNAVPVAQTTNQDTTLVFSSGTSNQIFISDPDAGSSDMKITLTPTNGTVTLFGTTGLTFSIGDGTADATMTFVGTIANINTALNGLMFIPTTSYSGAASLEIITKDQGNTGTAPLDGDANITTKYTFDVDGTDAIGANDATLNNGAAVVTDAERGNVLSTDGVDDHAEVPTAATNGLSQFSFSFWVKTTESRSVAINYWQRPTLFGMEITGFGSNDMAINTNNGFIGFWTGLSGGDASYLSTTTQINDNQWHQVTVSNNGANASLYVDGVIETSLATGNGLANLSFYIGALHSSTGGPVTAEHSGFFDNVRIFNRSLTAQEASDLYSLSDTDSVAITVTSAPTLDLDASAPGNDFGFTFTEGDGPTTIADMMDTDIVIGGSSTFASVKLAVSGLLDGSAETIVLDGSTFDLATAEGGRDTTFGNYHVTISTGTGTANVVVTRAGGGTFSEAETETLIEAIQYQHTDTSTPTDGNRLIDVLVNDGITESAAARSTINVDPVNDPPIAVADGFTVNEGSTNVLDLGNNDSDPDDGLDLTSITILAGPTNGTIDSINADGTVTYTHNGTETLSDSFTYTIDDLTGMTSNTVTVSLTVTPQNDPPTAVADSFTVNESSSNTLNLAGNDTDADDSLDLTSIAIVSGPANGIITSINTNGTVDYTHNGSETVADSFTYTINDLAGATSNTATVNLTITPQNDAPVITSDGGGASANVRILTGTTRVTGVTATDAEGTPVTYSITGGADAALFTIDSTTGVLTFLTAPNIQTPGDVGGDNIYDVIVQTSDGTLTDTQEIAVTITDLPVVVLPPTADPPSESLSESGEDDAGESDDEIIGNVLNAGSNSHGHGSGGNQHSTGNDSNDSNQLNHLAKDDAALMQHLRNGNGIKGSVEDLMGLFQQSFDRTTLKSEIASLLGTSSGFLKDLDEARDALNDVVATEKTYVASSIAASTGLSVGYVFWLLRSGVLLTALLSSVPAWQFVNPLLVLDTPTKNKRRKGQENLEDDSVEAMFENHSEPTQASQSQSEKDTTSH